MTPVASVSNRRRRGRCGRSQRMSEGSAKPRRQAASMRLQLLHAPQNPRNGAGFRTERLLASGAGGAVVAARRGRQHVEGGGRHKSPGPALQAHT